MTAPDTASDTASDTAPDATTGAATATQGTSTDGTAGGAATGAPGAAAAQRGAPNQFALLGTRRFLPLFLVQFLGAFNDQVYQKAFVALVTYRLAAEVDMSIAMLGIIASGLFILPFAIITPTAGQIADRIDKAFMMKCVKGWEIVVMCLAVVGYHTQNIMFLYLVLFLMGAQSAVFAPIKYSVLPQYLSRRELIGGNGLVQGSTFIAILVGTIMGNELILTDNGVLIVSVFVVTIAVLGFIASLFAPPAGPTHPPGTVLKPVDWVFPRAIWRLVARVRTNPPAFRTILFISWFWFLGATFLSLLPAYAKEILGADEGVLTVLLAAFSVGVALGAISAERLCLGRGALDVPPWGALGMAIMAVELYMATPAAAVAAANAGELVDRATFFASAAGWRVAIDFTLLAAFAGLYVTPLNAVLQAEAEPAIRGQYIAASNVVDASFMVFSAIVAAILTAVGLAPNAVLTVLTLSGIPMALIVAWYAPGTRLNGLATRLWPRGPG
ncbi:MAG: MFS transporter [Pseudomonadota bacterium]